MQDYVIFCVKQGKQVVHVGSQLVGTNRGVSRAIHKFPGDVHYLQIIDTSSSTYLYKYVEAWRLHFRLPPREGYSNLPSIDPSKICDYVPYNGKKKVRKQLNHRRAKIRQTHPANCPNGWYDFQTHTITHV